MEEIEAIADAGDMLHDAQRDIRQLKETIAALRDELEAQAHEKERAVQEATATADHEIHQLRRTAGRFDTAVPEPIAFPLDDDRHFIEVRMISGFWGAGGGGW